MKKDDEHFMREALKEARKAFELDEVPVGAVIVCETPHINTAHKYMPEVKHYVRGEGKIISRAHNLSEKLTDATAHAEMQAFTAASSYLGGKYLNECTLYVTIEPCVMCAGASFWTQIGKIVYGAKDEKRGYSLFAKNILHPKTKVVSGVLEEECAELMREFFKKKRN
jgi:tRNA(adenine34) deaminase